MNIKELRKTVVDQAFALEKAKVRGVMVNQETERTKNVLMNKLDDIVEALTYAEEAEEKIQRLTVEIEAADEELGELDDKIKELEKKANGKKAAGKRSGLPVVDESVEQG